MSTNGEKRLPKSPGGDSSDLFGAEFIGSPCHHRVLKPPGGGTSDIFGGSEPVPAEKSIARKHSAQMSSIVLDDNCGANAKPVENGHSKSGTLNERLFGPPLESKLNGTNCAPKTNGEVVTNGTDHTDAAAPVKPSQPVSNGHAAAPTAAAAPRARVPPGGFSSGLW